ncbi:hypothetical protein [Bradyrhizobium roseum]|uniref:hypothetical protein n=1 Tax=Bradyrhizobium roseum TaxID=3056648 RepID=UPI0026313465|nr:hypothetical protein [Bradyrhizobium roseus]WKA25803.1 hypothetical protein QUH67_19435 [Bradyrhizobium roseus]
MDLEDLRLVDGLGRPVKFLLRIMLATALVNLAPAVAKAPKEAVASPALQKEFDGFIEKFRAALKANDSAAIAGMARLPFMNDSDIRDAAQFRAKTYATSFKAKNRACLQRGKALYAREEDKTDSYYVFCGEDIFVFTKTPAGFLLTDISVND